MAWIWAAFLVVTAVCGVTAAVPVLVEESVYGEGGSVVRNTVSSSSAPVALPQVAEPVESFKQMEAGTAEGEAMTEGDVPAPVEPPEQTTVGYAGNKLYNDYPPENQHENSFRLGSHPAVYPMQQPVFRPLPHPSLPAPHPMYPMIYRGYPYMYGYPLDFRYGYAYGHAFGTDDSFVCPSDGRFYRDFGSFFNCDGGHFTVQFCAPGSKNAPPGRLLGPSAFCNVNLVGGKRPLLLPH